MKTPISIDENGDVSVFASVEDAEAYMEAIDVERGEYVVTDADGGLLAVNVVVEAVPMFWGFWKSHVKKIRIVRPTR